MDVLMPQLGETVAEGKITKWFKNAGDAVQPGDNLFEIETDKVSMEVPSITAGTLSEIRVQAGAVALVGAVVAVIAGAGGAASPQPSTPVQPPAPKPAAPVAAVPAIQRSAATPSRAVNASSFAYNNMDAFFEVRTPTRNFGKATTTGGTSVTPLARRLAGENRIDLSSVSGSGPHGRIVAADVEAAIVSGGGRGAAMATGASADQVKALYQGVDFEEVPLDGMRATIARRLVEAKQTIPHFYLSADLDIGRLMEIREEANAAAPKGADKQPAYKLSLNDFVIKAWAVALARTPGANAAFAEDRVLRFAHADIGVAVAMEGGLITPVIRNADTKSVVEISAEMRDFAGRARARKLKPHEYQGGASAISNLGMYGVREFAAIINPPQATILAIGAARRVPVEAEDLSVKFASQVSVTISCDHRVIDGALGAQLLATFKTVIEFPLTFLIS